MGSELLSSSLSDSDLYYVSPLLSSYSWSTFMLDMSVVTRFDYLHNVLWDASFILQFFFSVLFEGARPSVVDKLAALEACDVFVYICCHFVVALFSVLCECQFIVAFYFPALH